MESASFVDNLPVQTPTDMIPRRTGDVVNGHHILKLHHIDMSPRSLAFVGNDPTFDCR